MYTFVYFVTFSVLWFGIGVFTSIYIIQNIYQKFGSITNMLEAVTDKDDIGDENSSLEEFLKFTLLIMIGFFWPAYVLGIIEKIGN